MSKIKAKRDEAIEPATPPAEPTQAEATPHGWSFVWASSGVVGVRGHLEFSRLQSAVVGAVGNAGQIGAREAVAKFLASDPAAKCFAELKARLAKAESQYDEIKAEHRATQVRFLDNPEAAPDLESSCELRGGAQFSD